MRNLARAVACLMIACPLVFLDAATAADWPMFGRDQSRNAVSPEKNPPLWWQLERRDKDGKMLSNKNIRWSTPLNDGTGLPKTYGDPVVVDGMVWVGTNNGRVKDASVLVCLDEKTGAVLYRHVSPRLEHAINDGQDWHWSSMAGSPLIDGERMWFVTNRREVVCLDIGPLKKRQGAPRELWKVDLRRDLAVFHTGCHLNYRLCSVAAHQDLLFVITGNGVGLGPEVYHVVAPKAPSLVCFNKNTGKVVWQDNSPGKNILSTQHASPTVIEINGQAQVVAPQGDGWVRSFDAATGKLLWKFDTNPPESTYDGAAQGTRNYLPATAVFYENRIYIGNGRGLEMFGGPAYLYCIDPTKSGDISPHLADGPGKGKPNPNSGMIWRFGGTDERTKKDNFDRTVSNVAIDRGLLIAQDIPGSIHCLDARTGWRYWVHDIGVEVANSPLIVDGKVYVAAADGEIWILDLAKEKKVLDVIMTDPRLECSPVFANGVLYVAPGDRLYAIAGNEKKPQLRPVAVSDPQVTQKRLADLDSDRFEVRERAQAELIQLGEGAIPALHRALEKKPPLEVVRRLEAVLEQLTRPSTEYWEMVHEIQSLERIATVEARQLLESLAQGAAGARQTTEAQKALKRLAEQSAAR